MSKTLTIAVCFAAACLTIDAQQPFVYLVKAGGCATAPSQRSLTGFRVNDPDRKGIITALHGVVGCSVITARAGVGEIYTSLYLGAVDVESDVALLTSSDLQKIGVAGLTPLDHVPWEQLKRVRVYGHPFGTAEHGDELTVREPALRPLEEDVPATETLGKLQLRSSPSTKLRILSLQGPLEPGHSGAPILYQGKLIAIANGGLFGGTVGLGWAVPYEGVKFAAADTSPRLPLLKNISPDGLFSFEPGETQISDKSDDLDSGDDSIDPDMHKLKAWLKQSLLDLGATRVTQGDCDTGPLSILGHIYTFGSPDGSNDWYAGLFNLSTREAFISLPSDDDGLIRFACPPGNYDLLVATPHDYKSVRIRIAVPNLREVNRFRIDVTILGHKEELQYAAPLPDF